MRVNGTQHCVVDITQTELLKCIPTRDVDNTVALLEAVKANLKIKMVSCQNSCIKDGIWYKTVSNGCLDPNLLGSYSTHEIIRDATDDEIKIIADMDSMIAYFRATHE